MRLQLVMRIIEDFWKMLYEINMVSIARIPLPVCLF